MKYFLVLLIASILFVSCEDLEDSSPVMQGTIDNAFFRAIDARATIKLDGNYLIEGFTQDETLSLRISSPQTGTYQLGGESENTGSFKDVNGNIYKTRPNGNGEVIVTSWDTGGRTLSGTFNFNAILEGVDTLTIHRGIFFEVPYSSEIGDPIVDAGTVSAEIDGEPWNAFTVTAIGNSQNIHIWGSTATILLLIALPIDVVIGTTELPEFQYGIQYSDSEGQEPLIYGTITIIEHNMSARTIKGEFEFFTPERIFTLGKFNVTYQ